MIWLALAATTGGRLVPRPCPRNDARGSRPALALAALLALPASAAAHTIKGLVHDARDVVLAQAPGTHAAISADGVHLVLRRDGARVVEVLDLQGPRRSSSTRAAPGRARARRS